jgi:hypothetical protein
MKRLILLSVYLCFLSIGMAQVPNSFNYQAVVRNNSGEIIADQNVAFKISILKNTESGSPIYVETHKTMTNKFGLANLKIGTGSAVSGTFSPNGWGSAKHFVKVELDPKGGSSFSHIGTNEFSAVPYAFHAQTVENDQVDDADHDPKNEIQTLDLSGTQLSLSKGGGTVTLPSSGGGDNWGTQTVVSDATLSGKGTTANPLSVVGDLTDNQTLSLSGNDLSISRGNKVTLPEAAPSIWNKSGENIYFNTGKVGIGTNDPATQLDMKNVESCAMRLVSTSSNIESVFQIGIGPAFGYISNNNGPINLYAGPGLSSMMIASDYTYIANRLQIGKFTSQKPAAGLHVKGKGYPDSFAFLESDAGQDAGLRLYEGTTAKWHIFNNSAAGGLQIYNSESKTAIFAKQSNSYVGIGTTNPTYPLHVNGDAAKSSGTTAWVISSDRRLKNIHGNYEKGLSEIVALQPIKFSYKKDNPRQLPSDSELVGFVAQDVQKVFPEAVNEEADGYLDFNIHSINVAMVNAIKELKLQNGELAKEVSDLKSRLEDLETMVKASVSK